MNRQKWFFGIVALALMAGTAGAISWLRTSQKLGVPGIKATPIPGSVAVSIRLPEKVLDYTSEAVPQADIVTNMLPKDTSYAQRRYVAPDGFWVVGNIILMGKDRGSIHRPEFCLGGQGWSYRNDAASRTNILIGGPNPYRLPVAKWVISQTVQGPDGQRRDARGLYVFWFVADNKVTTSYVQLQWWLTRNLLLTGVLERWAYVSYLALCEPGQEDTAFERMQELIAASVPEFQLPLKSVGDDRVAGK
jgi:hypothetical protein